MQEYIPRIMIIWLAFVVLFPYFLYGNDTEDLSFYEQALVALDEGNVPLAIELLEKELALHPNNEEARALYESLLLLQEGRDSNDEWEKEDIPDYDVEIEKPQTQQNNEDILKQRGQVMVMGGIHFGLDSGQSKPWFLLNSLGEGDNKRFFQAIRLNAKIMFNNPRTVGLYGNFDSFASPNWTVSMNTAALGVLIRNFLIEDKHSRTELYVGVGMGLLMERVATKNGESIFFPELTVTLGANTPLLYYIFSVPWLGNLKMGIEASLHLPFGDEVSFRYEVFSANIIYERIPLIIGGEATWFQQNNDWYQKGTFQFTVLVGVKL